MASAWVIGETNIILALICKTWCKTQKQTTMPKETFPKETDHECDNCKFFWHFLLQLETCFQTSLIKVANVICKNLEMRSSELCKNCQKCPSLHFVSHAFKFQLIPWHSFKMQNAWAFRTWPLHLLFCYTYPCALMQALTFKKKCFAQIHISKL
jgi:hypothetical protein